MGKLLQCNMCYVIKMVHKFARFENAFSTEFHVQNTIQIHIQY